MNEIAHSARRVSLSNAGRRRKAAFPNNHAALLSCACANRIKHVFIVNARLRPYRLEICFIWYSRGRPPRFSHASVEAHRAALCNAKREPSIAHARTWFLRRRAVTTREIGLVRGKNANYPRVSCKCRMPACVRERGAFLSPFVLFNFRHQ